MSASLSRYVRSATLDVLGSDYLRTARALGVGFTEALLRHGVRNGAVPVVSVLGIELATTLLGAVVVESVFTLPGLGSMLLPGIEQHDYPNDPGRAVRQHAVRADRRLPRPTSRSGSSIRGCARASRAIDERDRPRPPSTAFEAPRAGAARIDARDRARAGRPHRRCRAGVAVLDALPAGRHHRRAARRRRALRAPARHRSASAATCSPSS